MRSLAGAEGGRVFWAKGLTQRSPSSTAGRGGGRTRAGRSAARTMHRRAAADPAVTAGRRAAAGRLEGAVRTASRRRQSPESGRQEHSGSLPGPAQEQAHSGVR